MKLRRARGERTTGRKIGFTNEWLAPSFEIVDCHFAEWKFKPADSAADFSFHWRLVAGTPRFIRGADLSGGEPPNPNAPCTLDLRLQPESAP